MTDTATASVAGNGHHLPPVETRFQPGVSGNPGGNPRGTKRVKHRLRNALIRRLRDHPERIDMIVEGLISGCAEGDAGCQRIAWDRLDGAVLQKTEHRGGVVIAIEGIDP